MTAKASPHTGTPAIDAILSEHADLERRLADPALHADPASARKVGRRFAQLAPIVATHRKLDAARGDLETARELAADDESFAAEVTELQARVAELDTQLTDMLAPRDPHDADDVLLEVKSGEGGEESALFAADLARMYTRYAERHGWTVTMLDETTSDLGGYKEATLAIASKGDTADGVWSRLKFEGGVHRVQRVPVTESQGRVHTSAAVCWSIPSPRRSARSRSTSPTCVSTSTARRARAARASTPPTRRCASRTCPPASSSPARTSDPSCRTRPGRCRCSPRGCRQSPRNRPLADASADRASQIRTVDRSERIRTYNFPENRITDHRIGFKSHNLDQVLDGELDPLFDALAAADKQSRLQHP